MKLFSWFKERGVCTLKSIERVYTYGVFCCATGFYSNAEWNSFCVVSAL